MNLTGYDSYIAMLHDNYHNDSSNKTFVIGGQIFKFKILGRIVYVSMNWKCMYSMSINHWLPIANG